MELTDETALICDFAETYHIYDYKALPVRQAAALAAGLGDNSRIRRKLSGLDYSMDTMLLAQVVDALNLLVWFKTENGQKNIKRPKSMVSLLMGDDQAEAEGFETGEDFDKWLEEMRNG